MGKAKVFRNLETAEDRRLWRSVEAAAEVVRAWPTWKRGVATEKKIPELRLLMEKLSFLEECLLAASEELQEKIEEFEIKRENILSEIRFEIKDYRKEIKRTKKLIDKARKKSGKSESPIEVASHVVASWSPSKRAAFEQRTGLKLPDKQSE